jgi:ankyrin repeat protein
MISTISYSNICEKKYMKTSSKILILNVVTCALFLSLPGALSTPDINTINPETGTTPLYTAVYDDDIKAVNTLLAQKADPSIVQPGEGFTPLMLATINDSYDIAKLILATAPHVINATTVRQYSALTLAVYWQRNAIVDLLLKNGANVDQREDDGSTALLIAAERGYAWGVRRLLIAKANPCARNKDGNNAADLVMDIILDHTKKLSAEERFRYDQIIDLIFDAQSHEHSFFPYQ